MPRRGGGLLLLSGERLFLLDPFAQALARVAVRPAVCSAALLRAVLEAAGLEGRRLLDDGLRGRGKRETEQRDENEESHYQPPKRPQVVSALPRARTL